jgi:hypothetical protein
MFKPDRDSRWTRHSFDCRAAILAANKRNGGEDRRPTILAASEKDDFPPQNPEHEPVAQYPKAFLRSAAVGRGSLRIVIASVPESFSCLD